MSICIYIYIYRYIYMRIPSPLKRGRRHQGVSPFIDWKVYLSIYPSIHVSIYNTVCVYIYIYLLKKDAINGHPQLLPPLPPDLVLWPPNASIYQVSQWTCQTCQLPQTVSLNFARSSLGPEAKFTSWVDPSGGSNGESANHGGLAVYFFIVFIHPLIPSDSMWFLHLDIVEICRHRNQRVYESGILHCLSTNCRQSWLGSVICSLFPGCLGLIL